MFDPDPLPTLPRLADAGSACIVYPMHVLSHAQMIDCQHQVQPHHVQDYHYHNISPDLRDHPSNHRSPFLLIVSSVIDNFRYILAILLKQNGFKTGRF